MTAKPIDTAGRAGIVLCQCPSRSVVATRTRSLVATVAASSHTTSDKMLAALEMGRRSLTQ